MFLRLASPCSAEAIGGVNFGRVSEVRTNVFQRLSRAPQQPALGVDAGWPGLEAASRPQASPKARVPGMAGTG